MVLLHARVLTGLVAGERVDVRRLLWRLRLISLLCLLLRGTHVRLVPARCCRAVFDAAFRLLNENYRKGFHYDRQMEKSRSLQHLRRHSTDW